MSSESPTPSQTPSPLAPSQLAAWAALVRLPNVFTVIADTSSAFLLVLGLGNTGIINDLSTSKAIWIWLVAMACVVPLYWAGMILNDVFDLQADRQNQAARPLPRGWISIAAARRAGWGLLLLGIAVPVIAGTLSLEGTSRWTLGLLAISLAVCIVSYNGPLKRTPLAAPCMGVCRGLVFLIGGQAGCVALNVEISPMLLSLVWLFAIAMTIYITGITTFARREAKGESTFHLPLGLLLMTMGALLIALTPRLVSLWHANEMLPYRVEPMKIFPLAIGFMLIPTLWRGWKAMRSPSPQDIGATIRSGLLAIIPIAAAITVLSVGATFAVMIFALMFPSAFLANRFRVT